MRLGPIVRSRSASRVRATAEVDLRGERRHWWVEVDESVADRLDHGASPFLPLASLAAASAGEDLHVAAPVDRAQADGHPLAVGIYERWWGWRPPELLVDEWYEAGDPSGAAGLLFSRGVDSSAELAGSVLGVRNPIDLLVTVRGTDAMWSPETTEAVIRGHRRVAAVLGVHHVVVVTNLRAEADRIAHWGRTHGAVTAGAALAVGGGLGSLTVSQSIASATQRVRDRPFGIHRELVRHWSTRGTLVGPGEDELDRFDKVERILRVPELARSLHVCWESDTPSNCGRCVKCLLTSTVLQVLGRDDLVASLFDAPPTPERIRRLDLGAVISGNQEEVFSRLDALAEAGDECARSLAGAWAETTARSANASRAGLAGCDVSQILRETGDSPLGMRVLVDGDVGWGGAATPVHPDSAERDRLVRSDPPADRSLPWCQVDRLGPFSARVAATLSDLRPGGAVMLVETNSPTAPAESVRRILSAATVRCWASASDHLEAVPLLEALQSGCVPLQVCVDVDSVRRGLPEFAHGLVTDLAELAERWPDDDELAERWSAAVALAAGGTARRDAVVVGAVTDAWAVAE